MRTLVRLFVVALIVVSVPALWAQAPSRDALVLVVNRAPKVLSVLKADGANLALIKKLPVGNEAREVCVSPTGNRAYVFNGKDKSITVVDLNRLEIVTTITDPQLDSPDGGVVSADSKTLYVTMPFKNAVAVIDTAANKVVNTIATGGEAPRRVIISPDGKLMYVGFNKNDFVGVIDLASGKVLNYIKTGDEPRGGFAFTADGKVLLSGAVEGDTVAVIDTSSGSVKRIFGVPIATQRIAMTPRGEAVVLSGGPAGHLSLIGNLYSHDKTQVLPVGKSAWGLALNEDGTISYSANYADGTLTIIDLVNRKVLQTFPVGDDPNGVAYRPGGVVQASRSGN
jgi:YVTN family beta-propeller protein